MRDYPNIIKDGIRYSANMGAIYEIINKRITSISILPSVREICISAFEYCFNLKEIEIPNTVTIIEDFAFAGCLNLEYIKLPDNLKSIRRNIFNDCKKLDNLVIPNSVNVISRHAFSNCESLKTLKILNPKCIIENDAFDYSNFEKIFYKLFKTDSDMIKFLNNINREEGNIIKYIGMKQTVEYPVRSETRIIEFEDILPLLKENFKGLKDGINYGI